MTLSGKISVFAFLLLPVLFISVFGFLQIRLLIIFFAIVSGCFIIREINRRKKIENNLRNYVDLVDHTQIVIRNMQNEIIFWNKGMERLYGWKKEEVKGRTTHQLFSTIFNQPLAEIDAQLQKHNEWYGQIKHTAKDGRLLYISSHWSLIRDEHNKPVAIVETNNDITSLKKIEEQVITLSREIDQSRDAIYTLDIDQNIKTWNRGAERLYGFSSEEAVGQQAARLLQTITTSNEINSVLKEIADRDHWSGELKRKTKAGHLVDVYASGTSLREEDGTISGYIGVSHSITEEVKLREQLNYFANLVDQSSDAIVSVAMDGQIVSWNKAAVVLYGYEAAEAIGRNIFMIIPPELVDEEREIINKIKNNIQVDQFETQRVRKDGTRIVICLTLSPIRNSEGVLIGASGIAHNLSDEKEAEQKIKQSEYNLKAIFDNASEGFILTDTNFIIKALNNRVKETPMFNLVEEIAPGKNLLDMVEASRKDYIRNIFLTAIKGITIQIDRSYVKPDGNTSWLNLTYNPVKKNDVIEGMCITVRDITEKKLADQRREFDRNNLQALINNTNDLMWSVGRDLKLITSNAAFDEMTRRMSGKSLAKGSNVFSSQFSDEQQLRYRQYYARAFAGEAFTEIEYTFYGFEYWAENSFYPIYEGGEVIGTACFSRNISEQRKSRELLQQSFNEKQALAERMSAIINTLPANIALLNDQGIIIDVNNSWRDFAFGNGFQGSKCCIGQNYISIAEKSTDTDGGGKQVADGISRVINDKSGEFVYEYACHSPHKKRWYRMVATPLKDGEYAGAVVMHVDISALKQLEQERLESKVNEQKKITRAMLRAQEKERNQLGREMHDNISQLLAALKMKLTFCIDNKSINIPVIEECVTHLDEAVNEARSLSHRMIMPRFAESSLADALKSLTMIYTHEKRCVTLDAFPLEEKNIPATIKETLYRIAQEKLHNIDKYAMASMVTVHIDSHPGMVTMAIEDNGVGFDTKHKKMGVGLTNIMHRAESFSGSAKIISAPGEGCLLLVEIPLCDT